MSLGKYPDVSLGQARERHSEARKLLAEGVDPMAQRKAAKTAEKAAVENSFQNIPARWLEHWQDGKSPRHVDYVKRRMNADILEVYQGTHVTRLAMKLLAFTFVRTSELIGATWDEFDLGNARWDLPAERMKMRTPHIVPLATSASQTRPLQRGRWGRRYGFAIGCLLYKRLRRAPDPEYSKDLQQFALSVLRLWDW